MPKHVLIVGGYGNFGALAAQRLARDPGIRLTVAGRSADKARDMAERLGADWAAFDYRTGLADTLARLKPDIVLHTSGPFQGQDYAVAETCIEAGCHYLDLADARAFVPGIGALEAKARSKGVLAVAGASSVPGLSAAIVDRYLPRYARLERVDYGIGTAQRTSRGTATTEAVLSYAGEAFPTLQNGRMAPVIGWQDLHFRRLPGIGVRAFANCDIPDLELFPGRYPGLKSLRFYAGLEVTFMQLGLWALSWLHRAGLLPNLKRFARPLLAMSRWFDRCGGDDSCLFMKLQGTGPDGKPRQDYFQVTARKGDGLYIPVTPAVILIRKLAAGTCTARGAMACLGLVSLDEIETELADLRIEWQSR